MNVFDLFGFLTMYKISLFSFFSTLVFLILFKRIIISNLNIWVKKTESSFDDLVISILESITTPYLLVISLFVSSQFVRIGNNTNKIINYVALAFFLFFVVSTSQKLINYFIEKFIEKRSKLKDGYFDASPFRVLSKVLKGVLWVLAIVIFLQNIGYNVSTLLAGIGIGGVAIAFALQNILEDIFAYFSIYFDRPFVVGDFLDVDGQYGTVHYIGIKSTRLISLQGEELIIPNQVLTSSKVHNYKKMKERRIQFSFGVLYETPTETIRKIPQILEDIIKVEENARFDRSHFKSFGDSSLDFEVVYFMLTDDYRLYMDTQQSINIKMLEIFTKENIEFAYPSRTLFIKK